MRLSFLQWCHIFVPANHISNLENYWPVADLRVQHALSLVTISQGMGDLRLHDCPPAAVIWKLKKTGVERPRLKASANIHMSMCHLAIPCHHLSNGAHLQCESWAEDIANSSPQWAETHWPGVPCVERQS